MICRYFFFLVVLFNCNFLKGQNFSGTYNFTDSIISNKPAFDVEAISQGLANSGYYQESLKWEDKRYHEINQSQVPEAAWSWKRENAIDQIVRLAGDARIVLINEGHDLPNTRVFVLKVLQALRPLGFDTYGAETFNWHDPTLKDRGYPVDSSGFYTKEPVYGELIREAIKMGYDLFPYEDSLSAPIEKVSLDSLGSYMLIKPDLHDTSRLIVKADGDEIFTFKTISDREIRQAGNIVNYLQLHPRARLILHVGYGHLCRDNPNMAYHLDSSLHVKMISIDLESLREHSDTNDEPPFYKRQDFKDYTAFTDSLGKPQIPVMNNGCKTDVAVAEPRTRYINGRPNWLYKIPGRKAYATGAFNKIKAPYILMAFYTKEYSLAQQHAVPIDIVEANEKQSTPPLLLRKGEFTVVQMGRNGQKEIYSIVVD